MDQINNFLSQITSLGIIDILIAIGIIIFFRIFSSSIAYIIIRMFKLKSKKAKDIRESAFYRPLRLFFIILGIYLAILFLKQPLNINRLFFIILGIYLAILFLKQPLNINNEAMEFVTRIFKIISIIAFANGIAKSFTIHSSLVTKMKRNFKKQLDDATLEFVLKIIRAIIYVIAGFIVLSLLGINLNGLIAGLGISGLIVTLAAQDTAKNLFGGLVIFIDKPFTVGDWIQMDTFEGTIEDITFRTTRIRTFENSLLNVPNSIISNASVINWSKMEKRRYKTNLRIELGTPIEKLNILKTRVEEMLHDRERIDDDSTIVRFDDINESGINMLIYTYTDSVGYDSYLAEVEDINCKLMKIIEEEHIKLAYENKNVYLKN